MKPETLREKRRARDARQLIRRLLAPLTENWGLKLISLLLALVIYHALKPTESSAGSDTGNITHERKLFQHP